MRGLTWAVVAILGGIVLVVGGGYLAFRDGGGGSSTTPRVHVSVPSLDLSTGCENRDPRLTPSRTLEFTAVRSRGLASASVSCVGTTIELAIKVQASDDVLDYEVWAYNNRDDAKDLGPLLTAGLDTVDIDDSVDSTRYHSIVLVPQDITKPARTGPAPIGFQAQL